MMTPAVVLSLILLAPGAARAQNGGFTPRPCDISSLPPYYSGRNYKGTCYFGADGQLSYWLVRLWNPASVGGGPDAAAPVLVGSTLFLKKQQEYNRWVKADPTVGQEVAWNIAPKTRGSPFPLTVQTPEEAAANDERERQIQQSLADSRRDQEWDRLETGRRLAAQEAAKLDEIRSTSRLYGAPDLGLTSEEQMLLNMPSEQAKAYLDGEAVINAHLSSDASASRWTLTKEEAESFVVAGSDYEVNPHGWIRDPQDPDSYSLAVPSVLAETGALNLDTASIPLFTTGVRMLAAKDRLSAEMWTADQIIQDLSGGAAGLFSHSPPPADSPLGAWRAALNGRDMALLKARDLSRRSGELIKSLKPGELPAETARQLASLQAEAEQALQAEEALAQDCARMKQRFERLDKLSPAYKERVESDRAWKRIQELDKRIAERGRLLNGDR